MGALAGMNVKWTGGGATASFQNAGAEQNWTYVSGGTGLLATGDYPGTGSTLQFLDSTVALPASNLPNAGEVFAIVVSDSAYLEDWSTSLTDIMGVGNWGYLSLRIGAAGGGFNSDIVGIDRDSTVGGAISLYAHSMAIDLPNAAITIGSVGYLDSDYGGYTLSRKLTILTGGTIRTLNATDLILNGGFDLAGTVLLSGGSIDVASPINVTGNCAINWKTDAIPGTLTGGLNAAGHVVRHTHTTGATLVCDVAGIINLGAAAVGLAVEIDAAGLGVTAGASIECGSFTMTAGTFTGGAYNVTAHGSIVHTAGTITGTGTYIMAATGNLNLDCATAHLRVSAGTATMTDLVAVSSVFVAAGATLDGATNNMTLATGRITGYGTLKNLVPAGIIHVAYGVIDGGNNSANVIFDPQQKMVIV